MSLVSRPPPLGRRPVRGALALARRTLLLFLEAPVLLFVPDELLNGPEVVERTPDRVLVRDRGRFAASMARLPAWISSRTLGNNALSQRRRSVMP